MHRSILRTAVASLVLAFLPAALPAAGEPPAPGAGKLKVLVVTGGHDFEPSFFDLFKRPWLDVTRVDQQATGKSYLAGDVTGYDTIVLYDMWSAVTGAEKAKLEDLAAKGQGFVVLHHAMADFQDWGGFSRLFGGRFFIVPQTWDGVERKASGYLHDVDFKVHVEDPSHPVVRGVKDFEIHDETYSGYWVDPAAHVLLTTAEKTSERALAWTKTSGRSRLACIQLGHDSKAWSNPNYPRLIENAIRWTAGRVGAVTLFDGRSLAGWERRGGAVWTVEDGILVGKQGPGNSPGDLFTRDEYGDFELKVVWQVVWPANSGVWFRFIDDDHTYQGDILEWKDPVCWSGSIYCPGKMFISKNADASTVDREGWNTMVIRASGKKMSVALNGKKVGEAEDEGPRWGRIGFQVHPGAEFGPMRIRVKEAVLTTLPAR